MIIIHLIYALFIALGIAWLFALTLGHRGPWNSIFWFFIVIFLFSWGGGVWLTPFGPTGWGVAWLPFLFGGFFIALLLSAAAPRSSQARRPVRGETTDATYLKEQAAKEKGEETALSVSFWFLIVLLAVVIVCNYIWHPNHSIF